MKKFMYLTILAAGLMAGAAGSYWYLQHAELVSAGANGAQTAAEDGRKILYYRNPMGLLLGGTVLFCIGCLNGSLTSGTGLFVTLWLVRWFGLDYKTAVAYTLILVGLFWNSFGAVTLSFQAQIKWDWLPALLLGSIVGGYVGAHLSIMKGNRWVKRCFETLTLIVGIKLIWDSALWS